MTNELLRRLTQLGTMHLIPADIHTKRIIRFAVTSQFTTADDILKDWSIISKTASTLLAETQALSNAGQPKSERGEATRAERNQDSATGSVERQEAASRLDKAEMELWIDKAWNQSRKPLRSLSCNSEPLPYTHTGPMSDCETRPTLKDAAGALPTPPAGPDPVIEITEMPSSCPDKEVLKKLTKFYSVPSLCNPWGQCGRRQVCCPLKVSETAKTNFTSTCRRTNCMSPSPVADKAPSSTPLETFTAPKLV